MCRSALCNLRDRVVTIATPSVYIHQNYVGSHSLRHLHHFAIVRRFSNYADLGVQLQHGLKARPEGWMVARDEDADRGNGLGRNKGGGVYLALGSDLDEAALRNVIRCRYWSGVQRH